ncbi:hypothetical protein TWF506_000261 [Arthrobotrys conoides]|uniref:Uncharacterized protein n=1 Tax=Arthrobotrys conoides TaxID=74498 RepID=A0AAN8NV36_9PEZI
MRIAKFILAFSLSAFEALIIPSLQKNETLLSQANHTISHDNQTVWKVNQTISDIPLPIKLDHAEAAPSNPRIANLSGLDLNTSRLFSKSEQRKDAARVIKSKSFYTWKVVCPSYRWVRKNTNRDPAVYRRIKGARRPDPMGKAGHAAFSYGQYNCEVCRCSDDGDIIVNKVDIATVPEEQRRLLCRNPDFVPKCSAWFGCRCEVTMHQPEVEPDSTLQEHQNALNNIPFFVKAQNPGWRWSPVDGFSMSWNKMGSSNGGSSDDQTRYGKHLVPGTKELYYLEGPDEFGPQGEELERLENQLWGLNEGYSSRSGQAWKRSNIEEKGIGQGLEGGVALEDIPT